MMPLMLFRKMILAINEGVGSANVAVSGKCPMPKRILDIRMAIHMLSVVGLFSFVLFNLQKSQTGDVIKKSFIIISSLPTIKGC